MARAPRPPFDPVWGAWVLLLLLLGIVLLGQLLIFVGCLWGVQAFCERSTGNLTQIAMEVITAVAILISAKKP